MGRERKVQAAKPPFASVRAGPAGADWQQHHAQPAWGLRLSSCSAFRLQQKKTLVSKREHCSFRLLMWRSFNYFPIAAPTTAFS